MKPQVLACLACVAVASIVADVSADPGLAQASQTAGETRTQGEGAPPAENNAVSQAPEGDLVTLARHPEAELLVNVEIRSDNPSYRYEIRAETANAILLVCHQACSFRIWPGRYRLAILSKSGSRDGEQSVLIDQDSRLEIKAPSSHRAILGATLAVAGAIAFGAGAVMFQRNECDEGCRGAVALRNRAGLALLLGGVVAVPVGSAVLAFGLSPLTTVVTVNPNQSKMATMVESATRTGITVGVAF